MEQKTLIKDCERCGKCCYFLDNSGAPKKCPYLMRLLKSKKTFCRIYNNRLGVTISENPRAICVLRKDSDYDYKSCPLNSNKPLFPA